MNFTFLFFYLEKHKIQWDKQGLSLLSLRKRNEPLISQDHHLNQWMRKWYADSLSILYTQHQFPSPRLMKLSIELSSGALKIVSLLGALANYIIF